MSHALSVAKRQRATGTLRETLPIAVIAILLLVVAPAVLPEFRLNLLAKFLTFAIIAVGLDLLWGTEGC